jgi:hypothetical protein
MLSTVLLQTPYKYSTYNVHNCVRSPRLEPRYLITQVTGVSIAQAIPVQCIQHCSLG